MTRRRAARRRGPGRAPAGSRETGGRRRLPWAAVTFPALLFNLSLSEIVVLAVVALLVFGKRLPQVAAQAAVSMQRLRRALQDLRRETGIDQEIWQMRRELEQAVPRDVQPRRMLSDAREEARRTFDLEREIASAGEPEPPSSAPAPTEPSAPDGPEPSERRDTG